MIMETIIIGCDHAGFGLKQEIMAFLDNLNIPYQDVGCYDRETPADYPVYAHKAIQAMQAQPNSRGILICGTGMGMSITANRFPGIRAALCHGLYAARMARRHNDANVLTMGERVIGAGLAREIVRVWLDTPFEGGRHQRRLDQIEHFSRAPGC